MTIRETVEVFVHVSSIRKTLKKNGVHDPQNTSTVNQVQVQ